MKPKKKKGNWNWTLRQWWFYLIVLIGFTQGIKDYNIYSMLGGLMGNFVSAWAIVTFFRWTYVKFKDWSKKNQ